MADTTNRNPVLFAVGLIAMAFSISLLVFSLYITPFMLFNAAYEMPTFIILLKYWYETIKGLSGIGLIGTVLLPFILSAVILALIAKRLTSRIEGETESQTQPLPEFSKKNFMIFLRPALYEILLICAVLFFLYLAVFVVVVQFQ